MGTLRLEPARVHTWAARGASAVWSHFDVQIPFYAAALTVVGLLMAYSNSSNGTAFAVGATFTRGVMWAGIAIAAFAVAAAFDYRWLRTLAWPIYVFNLGLLLLTLAVGTGVGGVSRWVTIGGLQFQFSEVAKILMCVVLANYLAGRRDRMGELSTFIGAGVLIAPPLALVLVQPDLGTSLVFGAILAGTLFLCGGSLKWLGLGAAALVAAVPVVWTYVLKDYQKQRLLSFLNPEADPQGSGYQLLQAQHAISNGGFFGRGLTSGTISQGGALPIADTDFVTAVLAEELGMFGMLVVFGLYVALLWRILLVGWRSADPFGLAFAAGIASMLLFQLLVNVGMVLGVMPITGIPLFFVTHGGASLVSISIGLGILEGITLRQARPKW